MDDSKSVKAIEGTVALSELRKLESWKETGEVISKLGLALVGSLYVVGLLVVNLYLRDYGVYHLGLLQIDYVLVGTLWAFLCGVAYYAFNKIPSFTSSNEQSSSKRKVLASLTFIGRILTMVFSVSTVLMVLSSYDLHWLDSGIYWAVATIILNVISINNLAQQIKLMIKARSALGDSGSAKKYMDNIFYLSAMLLVSFSTYARFVYPHFYPVLGGGKQQRAEFVIKANELASVKSIGIPVDDEKSRTEALEIIYEAPEFFLISPPTGFNTRKQVKSIRLRKETVDAVYYLTYKK